MVYLPLICAEVVFIGSVILYMFGPIEWSGSQNIKLISLLLSYFIAFAIGYIYVFKMKSKDELYTENTSSLNDVILKYSWVVFSLSIIASLILHRNLTHSDSYIPYTLFKDFYMGVFESFEVRQFYASGAFADKFNGNPLVSSLLLFLSVFKYITPVVLVSFWDKFKLKYKILGIVSLLLPVMSSICITVNAVIINLLITLGIVFFFQLLKNRKNILSYLKVRKLLIFIIISLSAFMTFYFYLIKSGVSVDVALQERSRVDQFKFLENDDIKIKKHKFSNSYSWFLNDYYVKLSAYVTSGYQGMNYALSQKFTSSFGAGHSIFIQRNLDKFLNLGLRERTYPYKSSQKWHEYEKWHSAYTYFANDVSFYGVIGVMFLFGYLLASTIKVFLLKECVISLSLTSLLVLQIFYMSANNQIFALLEYLTSFWILLLLFSFRDKIKNNILVRLSFSRNRA
ncbi:hypothetical protein ABMA67_11110 [Halobacteriovorax sp. RZ-3]|uniref:hypothetical protein n=1 Tax=Halobacteriovorax sp. RZ-3 TaxID=3157720 RepID=UPI00371DA5A9